MRRLRKRAPYGMLRAERMRKHAQALEFDAQRRMLFQRLRELANEMGELDPVRFLIFLRQQRRGYDPKVDGPSVAMQLLADIDALDELEREWAEGAKASPPTPA